MLKMGRLFLLVMMMGMFETPRPVRSCNYLTIFVVFAPLILCLLCLVLITLDENVCFIFKYHVRTECSL